MPDDGNTTRVTTGTDALPSTGKESSALEPIWDDEDTKAFYESLPDLRFTFHEIDNLFHYLASFYYSFEFFFKFLSEHLCLLYYWERLNQSRMSNMLRAVSNLV